jgi:PAS domain S-box-containing protein
VTLDPAEELRFRGLHTGSPQAVLVFDAAGTIVDANDAAVAFFGYPRETLIGLSPDRLTDITLDEVRRDLAGRSAQGQRLYQRNVRLASGEFRRVAVSTTPVATTDRLLVYAVVHDESEGLVATRRMARLAALTAALAEANGALLTAATEADVFDSICGIAVETGGMTLAWVGLVEPGHRAIRPVCSHGATAPFAAEVAGGARIMVTRGGMLSRTLTTGQPQSVDDIPDDMTKGSTYAATAAGHGIKSVACFPIRAGAMVVGAFQCSTTVARFFGPEELALVDQMASNASTRLGAIEKDSRRREAERLLAASEERYRGLFQAAPVGIMVVRPGGSEVNDALLTTFGYPNRESLGEAGLMALVAPEYHDIVKGFREASPSDLGTVLQAIGVRSDGSEFPLLIEGARMEIDGIPSAVVFLTDVSALASAEESARASLEQYLTLVESAPLPIVSTDLDGIVRSWNRAAEKTLGWSASEVLGLPNPVLGLTEPRDLERLRKSKEGTAPMRLQGRRHRRDGKSVDLRTWSSALHGPSGEVSGMLTVLEDVTAQRKLEAERARLAIAIEQSSESIVVTDPAATILYVNPAFEQLTGYSRQEAIGQNPRILKSGSHDPAYYAAMWTTLTSGQTWRGSFINRRKDGTTFEEEAVITPVHDPSGRLINYIAVKRDVTRERELEAYLQSEIRATAAVVGALERLSPRDTVESTAQEICRQMMTLPDVITTGIMTFLPGGEILSLAGLGPPSMTAMVGRVLAPERSEYFRTRASRGPWAETRAGNPLHTGFSVPLTSAGVQAIAYAPIRREGALLGVVALGAAGPRATERTSRYVSAVSEFAVISGTLLGPALASRMATAEAADQVRAILKTGSFHPVFEPIVDFDTRRVTSYEASTRFDDGSTPDVRFSQGRAAGLDVELESATLAAIFDAARSLPTGSALSINVSPRLILEGKVLAGFLAGRPGAKTLEISERLTIEDYDALHAAILLFGPDVTLAVDDAGTGFLSLRHLVRLRPSFVKIDKLLVRSIATDPASRGLVAGIAHLATEAGCLLVAEGLQSESQLAALRGLGVQLGQGPLFGEPAAQAS